MIRRRYVVPMPLLALAALSLVAAQPAAAQQAATIDPGMTRDEVIAKLGAPLSARSYDSFTYLLYKNGCERKCGMNDLVVLDSGKVVDAVFRSPARHYSGTSSSPRMISAGAARRGGAESPAAAAAPAMKAAPAPAHPPTSKKPAH